MPKQTQVVYIDDLDGTPLDENERKELDLSFGSKSFTMILSAENYEKITTQLKEWTQNSEPRTSTGGASTRRGTGKRDSLYQENAPSKVVKAWWNDNLPKGAKPANMEGGRPPAGMADAWNALSPSDARAAIEKYSD